MRNLLAASLAFATVSALAPVARAEGVTESSTGVTFDAQKSVDGKPYVLLGTGVRKKFIVKVYAMGLYVDEGDARRGFPSLAARAGGREHDKLTSSDHAQTFVTYGSFGKLGVLHFVRTVDADKIKEAYKESLEDDLSDKAAPEMRRDAQAFVDLFDREVKEGQELWIHSGPDGQIVVTIAGNKKAGPKNPKLARAIWNIWLGAKPISGDLKKGLVDRIDLLGK